MDSFLYFLASIYPNTIYGEEDEWVDESPIKSRVVTPFGDFSGGTRQQNKNRLTLFKITAPDGRIMYTDIDRIRVAELEHTQHGATEFYAPDAVSAGVIDDMFPITFPYTLDGRFFVECVTFDTRGEDIKFACSKGNGRLVVNIYTPSRECLKVNRLFMLDEERIAREVRLEDANKELVDKLMDYVKKCESNNG